MLPNQYFRPKMYPGWVTRLLMGFDAFPWSLGNIPLHQAHLHTTGWNIFVFTWKKILKSPHLAISSFPGRAFFFLIYYPNTINNQHLQTHFPTFQLWQGPLSFPSFTGDFSAPCTCGFLQDMRPKSRWIQLPGNSPGRLRLLCLLCPCFMAGKCGINTPHTTSTPGISTTGQ